MRRSIAALMLTMASALALVAPAGAAGGRVGTDTDVRGVDERDVYVGTGGLVLPATMDQGTRREVAACAQCRWRLTTPCLVPGPGNAFDGQSTCLSVVRGCPGGRLLRSWSQDSGGPWRELGLVCVPPAGPVTVAEVGRAVRARVERGIPALAPRFQPSRGVLTQLPVVFDSGQPAGDRTWRLDLLGREVDLTATPAWSWRFGDGAGLVTSDPGGRYPKVGVTHVYRRAATFRVACTTTWSGSFVVDGLGPFPVDEPVTQSEVLWVEAGEGRALLAPRGTARERPPG